MNRDNLKVHHRAMLLSLLAALCACQRGSSGQGVERAYIGPPGPIPRTQTIPANEYGAYTFSSLLNYCRGMRWIISGTMASLWPDEPRPILVKRGTEIEVLDRQHVECADLDERLSMVNGDLVHYAPVDGGGDRYVAESDVHTMGEYQRYAREQRNGSVGERRFFRLATERPPNVGCNAAALHVLDARVTADFQANSDLTTTGDHANDTLYADLLGAMGAQEHCASLLSGETRDEHLVEAGRLAYITAVTNASGAAWSTLLNDAERILLPAANDPAALPGTREDAGNLVDLVRYARKAHCSGASIC